MKKALSICLIISIVFSFIVAVSSDNENGVRIEFSVGDSTLSINGNDVTVETPFIINGVTLVPLRVITEAFGAEVIWQGEDRSIHITYEGISIILQIDNIKVTVDGEEKTLLEAPQLINSRTMVPLRFISENFGAIVDYNGENQRITVTKAPNGDSTAITPTPTPTESPEPTITAEPTITVEPTNTPEPTSSPDDNIFNDLIKRTNKPKIGDSYRKWTINFPKELNVEFKNFDGSEIDFVSDNEGYSFVLMIKNMEEDATLNTMYAKALETLSNKTIVNKAITEKDGEKYVKITFKDAKSSGEFHGYQKNGIEYALFGLSDLNSTENKQRLADVLKSFVPTYTSSDDVHDISDVKPDGTREFKDETLKVSMNFPADAFETSNDNKENEKRFIIPSNKADVDDTIIHFLMTSKEGRSLDEVAEENLKGSKDILNPKAATLSDVKEVIFSSGKSGKYYTMNSESGDRYFSDIYLSGDNYFYNLMIMGPYSLFKDTAQLAKVNKVIQSFNFTEPDAEKLGEYASLEENDDITKKVTKKEDGYSFDMPMSFYEEISNGSDITYYSNKDFSVVLSVSTMSQKEAGLSSALEVSKTIEEQIKKNTNSKVSNRAEEKIGGLTAYCFTTDLMSKDGKKLVAHGKSYILKRGETFINVYVTIEDLYYGEKFKALVDKMVTSFKFD